MVGCRIELNLPCDPPNQEAALSSCAVNCWRPAPNSTFNLSLAQWVWLEISQFDNLIHHLTSHYHIIFSRVTNMCVKWRWHTVVVCGGRQEDSICAACSNPLQVGSKACVEQRLVVSSGEWEDLACSIHVSPVEWGHKGPLHVQVFFKRVANAHAEWRWHAVVVCGGGQEDSACGANDGSCQMRP